MNNVQLSKAIGASLLWNVTCGGFLIEQMDMALACKEDCRHVGGHVLFNFFFFFIFLTIFGPLENATLKDGVQLILCSSPHFIILILSPPPRSYPVHLHNARLLWLSYLVQLFKSKL